MPPATVALWLEHAAEHQTRYYILVIGGVFAACGFALLAQYLTRAGERFYGLLGRTLITIALPLFVLNMDGVLGAISTRGVSRFYRFLINGEAGVVPGFPEHVQSYCDCRSRVAIFGYGALRRRTSCGEDLQYNRLSHTFR